jgi:hypothetical protein
MWFQLNIIDNGSGTSATQFYVMFYNYNKDDEVDNGEYSHGNY